MALAIQAVTVLKHMAFSCQFYCIFYEIAYQNCNQLSIFYWKSVQNFYVICTV